MLVEQRAAVVESGFFKRVLLTIYQLVVPVGVRSDGT